MIAVNGLDWTVLVMAVFGAAIALDQAGDIYLRRRGRKMWRSR